MIIPIVGDLTAAMVGPITGYAQGGGVVLTYDPSSRFSSGQQGAFVDLHDFHTLWQDTSRTVPVTSVGQTVKGITDKSGRGNHLTNATGWRLSLSGNTYYLQMDGVSSFATAAFAWGSGQVSIFMPVYKDSNVGEVTFLSNGVVGSGAWLDIGYSIGGITIYRRGSGAFGARTGLLTAPALSQLSAVVDLSGTTQATENPTLRLNGAVPTINNNGTADTGIGNFGTNALVIGDGYSGKKAGRIYSFFIINEISTSPQITDGESWMATRAVQPLYLDNGPKSLATYDVQASSLSHADYTTSASTMDVDCVATGTGPFASVAVKVNGIYNQQITPGSTGRFSATITLPAGSKTVSFFNSALTSKVGAFFNGAHGDSAMTPINTTPTNRLLVYGDSISVGANSTIPARDAWLSIVRDAYVPNSSALEGWGYRSLYDDASDSTKRAALVAALAAYAPTRIWLCMGTNDYGLNKWSASAFGTAYAALLDDLHTALPSAAIFCQTPIVRASEVANGSGSTCGDYRTQISTAVSTRTGFCTLVDGTAILTTADLDEGVHPTTAGHANYATYVRGILGI